MKTDKESGAPQFTNKDLSELCCSYHSASIKEFTVTVDDLNLFLRVYARKQKAIKHSKKAKGRQPK